MAKIDLPDMRLMFRAYLHGKTDEELGCVEVEITTGKSK